MTTRDVIMACLPQLQIREDVARNLPDEHIDSVLIDSIRQLSRDLDFARRKNEELGEITRDMRRIEIHRAASEIVARSIRLIGVEAAKQHIRDAIDLAVELSRQLDECNETASDIES